MRRELNLTLDPDTGPGPGGWADGRVGPDDGVRLTTYRPLSPTPNHISHNQQSQPQSIPIPITVKVKARESLEEKMEKIPLQLAVDLNGNQITKPSNKSEKQISLDRDGFVVQWDGLVVRIDTPPPLLDRIKGRVTENANTSKLLLRGVCGHALSGQLTAVMGPSGCGKTTLLNCLAGRRPLTAGSVTVAGRSGAGRGLRLALVPQRDTLLSAFSVRETLLFASRAKNPPAWSRAAHIARVDSLLEQLGLVEAADTRVQHCSGGQQRRVSIAQELVARPHLLLLDEPTSGLDSAATHSTLALLRRLAEHAASDSPLAVVASLHQPSARALSLVHSLYFLGRGGRDLYQDSPSALPACLSLLGSPPPAFSNPADFLTDLAVDSPRPSHDPLLLSLAAVHRTQYASRTFPSSQTLTHITDSRPTSHMSASRGRFLQHTRLVFARSLRATWRDPILTALRLAAHLLIPLFMAALFGSDMGGARGCPASQPLSSLSATQLLELGERLPELARERALLFSNYGFLFLSQLMVLFMSLGVTVLTFPMEAQVFRKEFHNGWYAAAPYFLGRSAVELLFQIALTGIYVGAAFAATGQWIGWEWWRLLAVVGVMALTNLIGQSAGLIAGAVFMDDLLVANFVAPTLTIPFAILNTFFVKLSAMTPLVAALTRVSFLHYSIQALILLVYGFGRCPPPAPPLEESDYEDQLEQADLFRRQLTAWAELNGQQLNVSHVVAGLEEAVPLLLPLGTRDDSRPLSLREFDLQDSFLPQCIIALLVFLTVGRLAAFAALLRAVRHES